jgi:HSP20 family protein
MAYNENKGEENRTPLINSLSNWFEDPFSTALTVFERPWQSLSRPFKDLWGGAVPNVDISETEKDVNIRAEIPGMDEKDLSVTCSQGILSIEGEKKIESEHKNGTSRVRESKYGAFRRDIPLSDDLNWNAVHAKYKNGVLSVIIPKSFEKKDIRKITID